MQIALRDRWMIKPGVKLTGRKYERFWRLARRRWRMDRRARLARLRAEKLLKRGQRSAGVDPGVGGSTTCVAVLERENVVACEELNAGAAEAALKGLRGFIDRVIPTPEMLYPFIMPVIEAPPGMKLQWFEPRRPDMIVVDNPEVVIGGRERPELKRVSGIEVQPAALSAPKSGD